MFSVRAFGVVATAAASALSVGYSYVMQKQHERALVEMSQALTLVKANAALVDVPIIHTKTFGVSATMAASAAVLLGCYSYANRRQKRLLEEKNRALVREKNELEETKDKLREELLSREKNITDMEDERREERVQLVTNNFRHYCSLVVHRRPLCNCVECVAQKDVAQKDSIVD